MTTSGWLLINKPEGFSSSAIVSMVRKKLFEHTKTKIKAGHTGTLDPFASGVLPIAIGEAVKLSRFLLSSDKAYVFDLTWGSFKDTDDITGTTIFNTDVIPLLSEIEAAICNFTGSIVQTPPPYSAIHINGKRAYKLAREKTEFVIPAREIKIYTLQILHHKDHKTSFYVECSKGTYIRSLARDLAKTCHSAGYVSSLKRLKAGYFLLKDTIIPDTEPETLYNSIKEIELPLVGIPAINIDQFQYANIKNGRKIKNSFSVSLPDTPFLIYYNQIVVGIGETDNDTIKPIRLLHNPHINYAEI